jgi:uncharacterized protein
MKRLLFISLVLLGVVFDVSAMGRGPKKRARAGSDSGSGDDTRHRPSNARITAPVALAAAAAAVPLTPAQQFVMAAGHNNVATLEALYLSVLDDTDGLNCVVDGKTALMAAAEGGCLQAVNYLVDTLGVDQVKKDAAGKIALMGAIEGEFLQVVRALLTRKMSRYCKVADNAGRTIMDYANATQNEEIIKEVRAFCFGTDAVVFDAVAQEVRNKGFFAACRDGKLDEMQTLQVSGHVDLNYMNSSGSFLGDTALMRAAARGDAAAIRWLVDKRADANMQRRDNKKTALMIAAEGNHLACVIELMPASNTTIKDSTGKRAKDYAVPGSDVMRQFELHERDAGIHFFNAVERGRLDIMFNLLDIVGIDCTKSANPINPTANDNKTALMVAIGMDNIELAQLLITLGANLNVVCAGDGNTALHYAVMKRDLGLVKHLLRPSGRLALGVDVMIENKEGKTARTIASDLGLAEIEAVIRDVEERSKTCCMCFDAIKSTDKEIVSCCTGRVNTRDPHWLQKFLEMPADHLFHNDCFRHLLASGFTCCPFDRKLFPPACMALRELPAVVAVAPDLHVFEHTGWQVEGPTTPLITAVAADRGDLVNALLAGGVDVNQIDASGRTALGVFLSLLHHGGAFGGGIDHGILIALLNHSADVIMQIPALKNDYTYQVNLSAHTWVNQVSYHTQLARHLINMRYAKQIAGLPGWRE